VQRGGFASEQDARDALERELERLRRERRITRRLTLSELVETYLDQHDVQPVTIEKLRYLLSKATAVFGDRKIGELTSQEIAAWRMTISAGYRFEATQALRQVLHRAVAWRMIDVNPAKVGVDNPVRRRKEQHPFESWAELEALAAAIGPRYGPMVLFAAATGLRPAEWIALEKRDVDREEHVVYVRRSFTRRELKIPKTEASTRAVPLQARASTRSIESRRATARRCCSPASAAATSTSTTSGHSNGDQHRRPPESRRCDGFTISGTPSRPSRFVPASQPSTFPVIWEPA
jgi:integrase